MTPEPPAPHLEHVAAFFQKHRTGLVTLVFTDLVDSTALMQQLGDQAGTTFLQQRRQIVRQTLKSVPEGEEIETAGDSFLLVFAKPSDAVRFALLTQARLRTFSAESRLPVQERMGIHLGEVVIAEHETEAKAKDLYGIQLTTCARVMALAAGGQILLTRGVFDSARQVLKGEDIPGVGPLSWVSHGPYVLKGIEEPIEVCEVGEAGQSPLAAPKTSEKAQRVVRPDEEPVLGWRPAVGQEVPNTKWVLEEKLGEGGFGEVWVGRHQTMKERRVFKFCFRADRVRSLKREMTLFRLIKERIGDHPNIVALREVYFDAPPFYVEEDYVAGQDLRTWCEAQGLMERVPLELKLEIVAQVADALQAAHDAGVIHRDVKPGNVLIRRSSRGNEALSSSAGVAAGKNEPFDVGCYEIEAKLTDFGIGQVVSQEVLAGVTKAGFTQTMLGSTSPQTGTQLYMAPELLAGKPATTRSDIYSLGVVLYQMLVGDLTRPVATDWSADILDPLLREDVRRCVTGKPEERFSSAAQLAENVRGLAQRQAELACREAEQVERDRLRRQAEQRHKIVIVSAGVAALLLLLAITLGYGFSRAEKQRRRAEAYLYDADVNLASQALHQNNLGRALSFLNLHRPAKTGSRDLRGWEWRYLWDKCRSDELATLGQHDGTVESVAVSPDGRWVASGGFDGLLKIWSLTPGAVKGRSVTNLHLGGGPVSSVAFSPDGRWLAGFTWTNGFVLLQAPRWRRELTVTKPGRGSLAFSANGRFLAVRDEVWSLDSRTRLGALPCHRWLWGEPAVAWSPNSETLAGFDVSNGLFRVSVFDVRPASFGAPVAVIPLRDESGRPPVPAALAFSPDGQHLAVGCWDNTIRIHAVKDWRRVGLLTNHTAWVSSLAFSRDGQWLASASADHAIRVWRARDWQETALLRGHLEEVWTVAFAPDGQRLVTGSKDHSVRLWPVAGPSRPLEEVRVPAEDTGPAFSLSGVCPFRVGPSNILTVWDGSTLQFHQRIADYPVTNVVDGAPSPDGRRLLMVTAEGGLWLMDLVPGAVRPPLCLQAKGSRPTHADFSGRAKWLAVADGDTLRVWHLEQQPQPPVAPLAAGNFWGLRFSQDERSLGAVTGPINTDNTVVVWELASGTELARFQPHRDRVEGLDFSPDGTVLATVSYDNTCKLLDLRQRQEIATLRGQLLALHSVCFSPDGRRLAVGTGDGGVNIWDLETGREVLVLKRHQNLINRITAVRFHPNGDLLLASGLEMRNLSVWRAPSWAEIEAAEKAEAAELRR